MQLNPTHHGPPRNWPRPTQTGTFRQFVSLYLHSFEGTTQSRSGPAGAAHGGIPLPEMHFPNIKIALCLGTLALIITTVSAQQSCSVTLTLSPADSKVTIGGRVTAPLASDISQAYPDSLVGLDGSLAFQVPGPCPDDADSLIESLSGAVLRTLPGSPLQLYPEEIKVQWGGWEPCGITPISHAFAVQCSMGKPMQHAIDSYKRPVL